MGTDITHLVQRMEALETRFKVRFESIYVELDKTWEEFWSVNANFEVYSDGSYKLKDDLDITVNVYDEENRLIGTSSAYLSSDSFYALSTESVSINVNLGSKISAVKLYPKSQ